MNMFRKTIAAVLLLAGSSFAFAHDFTATVDGHKIYFNIKSQANKTAEVTYGGTAKDKKMSAIQGKVEIPAKVKHNDVVYTIVAIGAKSFSGAGKLEGITIPSTVKTIGDFAFEGCTSLTSIVYPGSEVTFGEGVFFKCTSIKDISFGSDWKLADLRRYRWSDSLVSVTIPAKIEKIQGLKSLKNLKTVTVDANNTRFSSHDGVLYSKDGKILYGCPRSYQGTLRIKEGTEAVTENALIDCPGITILDFPASIKTLSFRETSRMPKLETVLFRGETPVMTAYAGKEGKFLLQIANPAVKIVVLKTAKNAYKSALPKEGGEFATSQAPNSTPYVVKTETIPGEKNIVGVKNFSKYNL